MMKFIMMFLLFISIASGQTISINPDIPPDFPGALQWGGSGRHNAFSGWEIVHVTTLVVGDPGGIIEALQTPNPRTIVFDVAGVFDFGGIVVRIDNPNQSYMTLAGSTAPGTAGVTFVNFFMEIRTDGTEVINDLYFENIRFRPGEIVNNSMDGADAFSILNNGNGIKNVLFAFCSFGPASDNAVELFNNNASFRIENVGFWGCTFGPMLSMGRHTRNEHAFALNFSRDGTGSDLDGQNNGVMMSLFANINGRAPRTSHDEALVANNVIYQATDEGIMFVGGFDTSRVDVRFNKTKRGRLAPIAGWDPQSIGWQNSGASGNNPDTVQVDYYGNLYSSEWTVEAGVSSGSGGRRLYTDARTRPTVNFMPVAEMEKWIYDHAGAFAGIGRDSVDRYSVATARDSLNPSANGGLIDCFNFGTGLQDHGYGDSLRYHFTVTGGMVGLRDSAQCLGATVDSLYLATTTPAGVPTDRWDGMTLVMLTGVQAGTQKNLPASAYNASTERIAIGGTWTGTAPSSGDWYAIKYSCANNIGRMIDILSYSTETKLWVEPGSPTGTATIGGLTPGWTNAEVTILAWQRYVSGFKTRKPS